MNKREFLAQLRTRLSGLPQEEIEERLLFYGEMIEDQKEDGLTEEEAVAAALASEEAEAQILTDAPAESETHEKTKPEPRTSPWVIVLLVLGSPIWLSLGIAALAILLSVIVTLWALIVSLWAVFVSLAACCLAALLSGVMLAAGGQTAAGTAMLAAGLVCAGLTIFAFYGCVAAGKGSWILTRKTVAGMIRCLTRKEAAR